MKLTLHGLSRLIFFAAVILLLAGTGTSVYAEGTKQVRPDTIVSEAGLMIDWADPLFTRFCMTGCPVNYRLNIHIKNIGEKIMFGLKTPYASIGWALKRPDGTIPPGMTGTDLPMAGAGYINYYTQAVVGPFPAQGGYTPLQYTADMTGDWYFEILDVHTDPNYLAFPDCAIFALWDFQVVSGANNPAIPADTLNGRVWSQSWQMYAKLETPRYYNGSMYIYTDDGIVTKLKCSTMGMGEGTFFCNPYGALNTGVFTTDRQSKNNNTFVGWPAIAQYKVFLNNPDITVYPNGAYGVLNNVQYYNEPGNPCSTNKFFLINVNKAGQIVLKIDVPYGDPTYDVQIIMNVVPGDNIIPWNCRDGHGNIVPDGTVITFTVEYLNGLTNMPLWDFEGNPNGYKVYAVRPLGPGLNPPMLYWDDSQLTATGGSAPCGNPPNTVNLTGCVPATSTCHNWPTTCHNKMINTWWYSGSTTYNSTNIIVNVAPVPTITGPSPLCIDTLSHTYTTEAGMTNYVWTVPAGGTITAGGGTTQNFVSIKWNTTGNHTISVHYFGVSCPSDTTEKIVNVTSPVTPSVSIVVAPNDTVCPGTSVTFTATPTNGGTPAYQWKVNGINAGTNSATYSYTPANGDIVTCVMTSSLGCVSVNPVTSNAITMVIKTVVVPVITGPASLCTKAKNIVYSTQGGMTNYVWTVSAGFTILGGQGTNTITVNGPNNTGTETVSVSFTSNGCTSSATLTVAVVGNNTVPTITIAASPNPACAGATVVFTSTITGGGTPAYQWQILNGAVWTNLANGGFYSGVTTATMTITGVTVALNGNQYRCQLTSSLACVSPNVVQSTPITLTVNPVLPASVSIAPSQNGVCAGTFVTFTATPVNGGTPSYQWKVNGINAGANSNTFTYTPVNGDVVTCVMTSTALCASPNPVTSNSIVMTVLLNTAITLQPVNATIPAGGNATFSVAATGVGLTYQWQVNTGSGWNNVVNGGVYSGATTATLSITGAPPAMSGYQYRCVVTGTCGTVTSDPATLFVSSTLISITCPADINQNTDPGLCTAAISPGFPTLNFGNLPVTYTWVMSGATVASGSGAIVPDPYTFNRGVTTITWTATNADGSSQCAQTITVTDNQAPTFTAPLPVAHCVEDIFLANYWDPTMDITPDRPEYWLFVSGNTELDLNPATFNDNCPLACAVEIRWRITFSDGTFLPVLPALYNTGQPSAHPTNIQFPGALSNDLIHTITYQIVDCNGNVSAPLSTTITVSPRPNVIKTP